MTLPKKDSGNVLDDANIPGCVKSGGEFRLESYALGK